jgi:hypothetical protein
VNPERSEGATPGFANTGLLRHSLTVAPHYSFSPVGVEGNVTAKWLFSQEKAAQ